MNDNNIRIIIYLLALELLIYLPTMLGCLSTLGKVIQFLYFKFILNNHYLNLDVIIAKYDLSLRKHPPMRPTHYNNIYLVTRMLAASIPSSIILLVF